MLVSLISRIQNTVFVGKQNLKKHEREREREGRMHPHPSHPGKKQFHNIWPTSRPDSPSKAQPSVSQKLALPIGPQVVPLYGLYLESYEVLPKRNYLGAHG